MFKNLIALIVKTVIVTIVATIVAITTFIGVVFVLEPWDESASYDHSAEIHNTQLN